ncbi:MAG: hypothetical protein IT425_06650, partial [Pirellulales bacterium]|nr:hypothetical protein [Pirellulales bacterium]
LPFQATATDTLGVRTLGQPDQVYGLTSSILSFTAAEVDAVSRKRDDVDRNDGTAWFGGNLTSAGDDYLLYDHGTDQSFNRPVTGTAMTPGDINTGNSTQSPLPTITSITPNAPVGTITVTFSHVVQQLVAGDGSSAPATGAGITITDTSGQPISTIDLRPTVTGIGSDTLILSFTGSAVSGGLLPPGSYQLNFVGNAIIANGRAVDVANNGTQLDAFREYEFTVAAPGLLGDFNSNNVVDAADYVVWRKNQGLTVDLPNDGITGATLIGSAHYDMYRANFGNTAPAVGSGSAASGSASVGHDSPQSPVLPATLLAGSAPVLPSPEVSDLLALAVDSAKEYGSEPAVASADSSTVDQALATSADLASRPIGNAKTNRHRGLRFPASISPRAALQDQALLALTNSQHRDESSFTFFGNQSDEIPTDVETSDSAIDAAFERFSHRRLGSHSRILARA